jgi:hypothetical protein
MIRCATGKVIFDAEAVAQMAVTDAKIRRSLRSKPTRRHEERAYQCPTCRFWHLSSKG